MKNIFKTLLFTVLLSGCYEDKGNYDYTLDSMNEITSISFTPAIIESATGKLIEVRQAITENDTICHIKVHLEQTLEKNFENLDFYWYRTHKDGNDNIISKDTVNTKGYLDIFLPIGEMVSQDILLQIYDNTTTLSHYSSFKFQTRPPFKNSLFVLHGEEGERLLGNIAIIGNDTVSYTDIKSITNDQNIYKNAEGLDYSDDTEGKLTLTVFSDNGATRAYEPFEMTVKFHSEEIFKPTTTDFSFKKIIKAGDPTSKQFKIVISENGKVCVGNQLPALYELGYEAEKNGNPIHITDYNITAATLTGDKFYMWDEKGKRFLCSGTYDMNFAHTEQDARNPDLVSSNTIVDANIDFSEISPVDKSAVLGYINYQQGWDEDFKDFYFIFKDEGGSYYRYGFRTGEKNSTAEFTIENEKLLNNFNPDDPNTIKYCSSFSTNYLFYAKGNMVYRYNVSNGDNILVYEAPTGYDVTLIKFRTEDWNPSNYLGDLPRIMSIALYNEAEARGAIAEIRFTTSADVDKDFTQLFYDTDSEGNKWKRIQDFQFAREHQYKLADYQKGNSE